MKAGRLAILIAALALATPVGAEACVPTTSQPEVDTNPLGAPGVPRYYVDESSGDPGSCGCGLLNLWVYEESNGIDGLQRHDEVKDDTCNGQIPGDTITF